MEKVSHLAKDHAQLGILSIGIEKNNYCIYDLSKSHQISLSEDIQ